MNFIDRVICEVDAGLRTVFAKPHAERPLPKPAPASVANVPAGKLDGTGREE